MQDTARPAALPRVAGIVLAGGASSRMGREKAFVSLGGRPVLAHVLERFRPQVALVAISANGDPARFAEFDCPVLADLEETAGHGPLAGVLAGLDFAQSRGLTGVAITPSDAPFLPLDFVARLMVEPLEDIAFAESASGPQPLFSVWPLTARPAVAEALERGAFSVIGLITRLAHRRTRFGPAEPDPFFNLNRPQDVASAERRLAPQ